MKIYTYFQCGIDWTGNYGCDKDVSFVSKEKMKEYILTNNITTGYIEVVEEGEKEGETYSPQEFLKL